MPFVVMPHQVAKRSASLVKYGIIIQFIKLKQNVHMYHDYSGSNKITSFKIKMKLEVKMKRDMNKYELRQKQIWEGVVIWKRRPESSPLVREKVRL